MSLMKLYKLDQTCGACPEQYDVFRDNKQVGYIRLRGGILTVQYSDAGGILLMRIEFENDPLKGMFDTQEEKEFYLNKALEAIEKHFNERITEA